MAAQAVTKHMVFCTLTDNATNGQLVAAAQQVKDMEGNKNKDGVEVLDAGDLEAQDPAKSYYVVKDPTKTDGDNDNRLTALANYRAVWSRPETNWVTKDEVMKHMLDATQIEFVALLSPEQVANVEGDGMRRLLALNPELVHADYKTVTPGENDAPDEIKLQAITGSVDSIALQLTTLVTKLKGDNKSGRLNVVILPAKHAEDRDDLRKEVDRKVKAYHIDCLAQKFAFRLLTPERIPKELMGDRAYELLSGDEFDNEEFDAIRAKMATEVCGLGSQPVADDEVAPAPPRNGADQDKSGDPIVDALTKVVNKDEKPSPLFKSDKEACHLKAGRFEGGFYHIMCTADLLEILCGECESRTRSEVFDALGTSEAVKSEIREALDGMLSADKDALLAKIRDHRLTPGSGLETAKALFEDVEANKVVKISAKKAQGKMMWKMVHKALVFSQSIAHMLCDEDGSNLDLWLQVNKKNLKPHATGKSYVDVKAEAERSKQLTEAKKSFQAEQKTSPVRESKTERATLNMVEKVHDLLQAQANGDRKSRFQDQRRRNTHPDHTEIGEPLKGRNGGYMSEEQQAWTKDKKCAKCGEVHTLGPFECPKLKNASLADKRKNEKASYANAIKQAEDTD